MVLIQDELFTSSLLLYWDAPVLHSWVFVAVESTESDAACYLGHHISISGCIETKMGHQPIRGYHHASCSSGGGFCIYPDITLAAHYMQTRFSLQRIMIIDLDAHQGNGHERDHLNRTDIFIVDAYNHHIYPGDSYAQQAIS